MKLYQSGVHEGQWLAYVREIGWVVFPARENGWDERRPARGIDPIYLREVPLRLAANTGIQQALEMQAWQPQRAA